MYADEIIEYLHHFVIPKDHQAQILTMYQHLQQAEGDTAELWRELEGRLGADKRSLRVGRQSQGRLPEREPRGKRGARPL